MQNEVIKNSNWENPNQQNSPLIMGKVNKTLLVAVNSRYTHSNPAVYNLRNCAKAKGCLAELWECNINAGSMSLLQQLVKQILAEDYKAVAFSCYIWNINLVVSLTKLLKQVLPKIIIIWGGPEVGFVGRKWLAKLGEVDYIIQGEGEVAFPDLLCADSLEKLATVANLFWRQGGKIVENPVLPYLDMGLIPFAYTDLELAKMEHRIVYYESSRGCPFGCHFCISAREQVRYRDLAAVKADLWRLRNSCCKKIKFVDRTFNSDKKRAVELIQYILSIYKPDLCFHIEIEPSCLDDELIELLGQAPVGYIQAEAGVQTLYVPALNAIGRHNLWQKAESNLKKLLAKGNIRLHLDLIGGLPYEDLAEFKNSFNQLYDLTPNYLQLGFLKILPGSVLEEEAADFGLVYQKEPPYQVVSTPWLSFGEMLELMAVDYSLDNYYNGVYFKETLGAAVAAWQTMGLGAFDFYRELAAYDQSIEGGKALPQKAELLGEFFVAKLEDFAPQLIEVLKRECSKTGVRQKTVLSKNKQGKK